MARRWVLLVIADATALTAVDETVRGLRFHVTTAPDFTQALVQARDLKPVLLITDRKPGPEERFACPVLTVDGTIDPEKLKSGVLALAEAPPPPPPEPVKAPAPAPVVAAAAATQPPPPPEAPKHWLVVASSDPAVPTIVEMGLLGLDLDTAAAASAARTAALADELKPELILCDLDLPGLGDGAATLRDLRRNAGTSTVPLILISGKDPGAELSKVLAADTTVRFLKKPLDAEKLRVQIVSLMTGEAPPPAPAPEPVAAVPARGTALVLDADPAGRALYEAVLAEIGLTATVGDPAQALNDSSALKPALIISDLSAPGAVEMLTAMRLDALLLDIPFLFVADMPVEQAMGMMPWGDPTVRFTKKPLDAAKVSALAAELTGWTGKR